MAASSSLIVVEQSQVSAPASACVGDTTLRLTFSDIVWLRFPDPIHTLFFYELPNITKKQFKETYIPNLKHSLSLTLQHFLPFAGNLILFPSAPTKMPEIRYIEGDSVNVTFAECDLDFNYLTGNHPRDCDKFYQLIPLLGHTSKVFDYLKMPVFALQVTLFPNYGISIGMTNHHTLCDATTRFTFLKAWTSIARSGTDDSFLANGSLPFYDRVLDYPEIDESYIKLANIESFNEEYQFPSLSGPSDKVRATFILTRPVVNRLKTFVSTQVPTLPYVSSFTVSCAYIWSCIAESLNDERQVFVFPINCRARLDPPIPEAYFGNCVVPCFSVAKTALLTGKEGFLTAAKLLGENLHNILTDKDGIVKDIGALEYLFSEGMPTTFMGVAGTPKLKFYDLDFGFGKPKKHETVSIDYNGSISISACKESYEDLEIGVCLSATEMDVFIRIFNHGLETYI